MSLFSQLCSCERSNGRSEGADATYARIVEAKRPSRTSISIPVYQAGQLKRPTRRATSSAPLIDFDEKHLIEEDERPSSSSQSSAVSIPSTHFTVLTASRTGAAASNRQSYDSNNLGPPPSYHSRRTSSPSPSDETIPEHPVMAPDWLERLQNEARADNDPFRDGLDSLDEIFPSGSLL